MRAYAILWLRAFGVVCCTAANVRIIGQGNYLGAFWTGGLLSFIWWWNSRTAAHSPLPGASVAYAVGAACGTVAGMWIGGRL